MTTRALRIHPVGARMLSEHGMDPRHYAEILDGHLMLNSWEHDHPTILAMPRHCAGLGKEGVILTIHLTDAIAFVSGPTEEASRLVIEGGIPTSTHGQLAGRHVTEIVGHPLLDVPGLLVERVEAHERDGAYLALAAVPWDEIVAPSGSNGLRRIMRGLMDSMARS